MAQGGSSELAKAYLSVHLDRKKLNQDLELLRRQLPHMLRGAQIPFTVNTSALERSVKQGVSRVHTGVVGAFKNMATIAGGILASIGIVNLTQSVRDLGNAMIGGNAQMEQYLVSMKVLMKDAPDAAAAAKKMMQDIEQFAAKTPFQVPDLTAAVQQLLKAGFAAEKVLPMMQDIGDVASSSPMGMSFAIQRISYALMQMKQAGKVYGQDMRQLTDAGVPAWKLLAEEMGVSVSKVKKMTESGAIDSEKAITAILAGVRKQFGGMMKEQSRSWNGLMSTLRDYSGIMLRGIGKPIFELSKVRLTNLTDWMQSDKGESFSKRMQASMANIVSHAKRAATAVRELYSIFGQPVVSMVAGQFSRIADAVRATSGSVATASKRVWEFLRANKEAIGEAMRFAVATAAMAAGVLGVVRAVKLLKTASLATMKALKYALYTNPFTAIVVGISAAVVAVIRYRDEISKMIDKSPLLSKMRDSFYSIASAIKQGAANALEYMLSIWREIEPTVVEAYDAAVTTFGRLFAWVKGEIDRNREYWSQWKDLIVGTYKNLLEAATNVFTAVKNVAVAVAKKIGEVWNNLFGTDFVKWLTTARDKTSEFFFWSETEWLKAVNKISDMLSLLTTDFDKTWNFIKAQAKLSFWDIVDNAEYMGKNLVNLIEAYQEGVKQGLAVTFDGWGAYFSGIVDLAQFAGDTILGNLANTIKTYFGMMAGVGDLLGKVFGDAMKDPKNEKMKADIKSAFDAIVGGTKANISAASTAFNAAFTSKRNEMPIFRHGEQYNEALAGRDAAYQAMVDERDRQRKVREFKAAQTRITKVTPVPIGGPAQAAAAPKPPTLSGLFGIDSIMRMLPTGTADKMKEGLVATVGAIQKLREEEAAAAKSTATAKAGTGADSKERKIAHVALADYNTKLQEALGKNSTADRTMKAGEQTAKSTKSLYELLKDKMAGKQVANNNAQPYLGLEPGFDLSG